MEPLTGPLLEWGSLAVRLPKALVDELYLAPGDELEVVSTNKRARGRGQESAIGASEFLKAMEQFKRPAPEGYKFDRDEATSVERVLRFECHRLRCSWT